MILCITRPFSLSLSLSLPGPHQAQRDHLPRRYGGSGHHVSIVFRHSSLLSLKTEAEILLKVWWENEGGRGRKYSINGNNFLGFSFSLTHKQPQFISLIFAQSSHNIIGNAKPSLSQAQNDRVCNEEIFREQKNRRSAVSSMLHFKPTSSG